jgi:hypothetical protein
VARRLTVHLLVAVATGLAVGGAAVLGLRLREGGEGPRMQEAVTVRASLSAPAILFGDPLRATVDVLVDGSRVDPAGVRLLSDFAPFRVRSRAVTRTTAGTTTGIRYELELLCLDRACLPKQGAPRPIRLQRGSVLYGGSGRAALDWPGVEVASRLSAADRVRPALRLADAQPPAPGFRVDPGLLAAVLLAGAALLAAGAAGLVAVEGRSLLARRRARDPLAGLPPVERALALLRRAATPAERRTALDRLARALEDRELADEARRLAWSEPAPDERGAADVAARAAPR